MWNKVTDSAYSFPEKENNQFSTNYIFTKGITHNTIYKMYDIIFKFPTSVSKTPQSKNTNIPPKSSYQD